MKMPLYRPIAALALALAAAAPARADLTIAYHTTIKSPQLQSMAQTMPAEINALLDQTITEYLSGTNVRVTTATASVLIDNGTHKMTMLMDLTKQYMVTDLDPSALQSMMPGTPGAGMAGAKIQSYKVVDSGKTTTYLGHKVRHYVVSATYTTPSQGTQTINSDMLVAQDLPAADMAELNTMSSAVSIPGAVQIKGVPLLVTTQMTGGPLGNATVKMAATSLSTKPVDASMFQIPSSYTQMQAPPTPAQ